MFENCHFLSPQFLLRNKKAFFSALVPLGEAPDPGEARELPAILQASHSGRVGLLESLEKLLQQQPQRGPVDAVTDAGPPLHVVHDPHFFLKGQLVGVPA